jgi:GTP cyclohydrolase I
VATPLLVRDDPPDAEQAVAQLLRAIGEDPSREGLERTPERVAKAMTFLNSGASKTPLDVLNGAIFTESSEGMVLVQDIEFYSLCEHHLLPFHGHAHIAYLPAGRVVGLSKLPRLLDVFARRLQVQERLTDQVARAVQTAIEPRGVAVRLEAAHFCMMMRGVQKQESLTMTSSFLGAFQRDMALRQEFYSALGAGAAPTPGGPRESRPESVAPRTLSAAGGREPHSDAPLPPSRIGVFTGESPPVPRGKYPQRVGPRPRREGGD